MAATSFLVDGSDGSPLVGYHWATDAPERGIVVLAHGLGEHSLRYQRPAEVDAYIADPLCGFGLDPAGVAALKAAAPRTGDVTAVAAIRQGFPVYIFSGTADPIHANLAWLDKLVARYTEAGLDVTTRYYAEGRHEMLNETNRDDVVADLVAWLERVVP